MVLDQTGPLVSLGRTDEGEQLGCIESERRIEVRDAGEVGAVLAGEVASRGHQMVSDRVLEEALVRLHAATPRMSN